MPGTGIAAPTLAALGENSRMLYGGLTGPGGGPQGGQWIRFVNGALTGGGSVSSVEDNMSGGFTEKSRGSRNLMMRADCIWRAADNPLAFPPKFETLQLTARIIIWPDFLNDQEQYYKMPFAFCEGFDLAMSGQGEARVGFSLTLSNHGIWYEPARKDPNGVYG